MYTSFISYFLISGSFCQNYHTAAELSKIIHVETFLLLMDNLTGDRCYRDLIPTLSEDEKGAEITMCQLLDKYIDQGISQGIDQGIIQGKAMILVKAVDSLMANMALNLKQACESIGSTVEEYQRAKNG